MNNIKSLDTVLKEAYAPLIGTSIKVFMITPKTPDSYDRHFVFNAKESDVEIITKIDVVITNYYLDIVDYECFIIFQFLYEGTTEEVTLR